MRVIDFFDKGMGLYPDNMAFTDTDGGCTYREAGKQTHAIARAISSNGYGKGAHIGILAPNSNIAFLALLSTFRVGAVWLPINPRNPVAINCDLLTRFDGELLLYHSAYEAEAREILSSVNNIKQAVCIDGVSDFGIAMADWIDGSDEEFVPEAYSMDDAMAISPTGGTTGKSKGVFISHRNAYTQFASLFAHFTFRDNDRHLVIAPMTHAAGLIGCNFFARGGTNIIMPTVDPESILRTIQEERITHLFLPPTVLYMLLAHPNVRDYDYSSLLHFFIGAAPTSFEKLKQAVEVFGPVMTESFGQTEFPTIITAKAPWDYLDENGNVIDSRLKSIGRPSLFTQVGIMDDDGNLLGSDERGEIVARGDLATPGYYNNREAFEETRKFGWHHTGDIGVMDEDGFITIVDRKKELIITGGFNVYPNEIEQALSSHPAIQECAVVGVPDEKWGESVKAVVQLKPGVDVDEADLIEFVKNKIGSVKAPKSVDFVTELPRSTVGKVLKTEIRKRYWCEQEHAIN
jgi:acyl-CoA synthetase (AMP-forming)/AMP-acid ligase II